jgi:hypothetical protein
MKFAIALLALPVAVKAFTAFSITSNSRPFRCSRQHAADHSSSSPLMAVVTGFKGKPAATAEEDLMLTLRIIMDHEARSTTTSKEQYISQMTEVSKAPEVSVETIDVSIPYDAAAKLAYNASDKKMAFEDFKQKYLADAVADVIAKQPKKSAPAAAAPAAPVKVTSIDVSIPYDAAAALAYAKSDKKMDYAAFKAKYEADAVADVISKRPVDLSIPYDAAAKLAYAASDKSTPYPEFKATYEANAVKDVIAKQQKKSE